MKAISTKLQADDFWCRTISMYLVAVTTVLVIMTNAHAETRPDGHAPVGIMGDHIHKEGELMLSYRYMRMTMEGNRNGRSSISLEDIVTSVPNPFASPPNMPLMLRVVPTRMNTDMHMFGLMYAIDDRVTLAGMVNYLEREMDHVTFMGPAGAARLGTFTTRSSGLGDTSLSALIRLSDHGQHRWHATIGASLPTGSIDNSGQVLTPMNTRPTLRLPYPMQLGSGTYDAIAGVTYSGSAEAWAWGGQWNSRIRLRNNDEGYTLGDEHRVSGWFSYLVKPSVSLSTRISYLYRANIDGIDSMIRAPVQTANPDRQGVRRLDFALGANVILPHAGHRLALEIGKPIAQDVNGPQLAADWAFTIGWQYSR